MRQIDLSDINIYDIGNKYQLTGTVWSSAGDAFITLFPDRLEDFSNASILPMSLEDWEKFLQQTDLLETQIFTEDPNNGKIIKAIWRKSQRNIDAHMQWAVFKRDEYKCRYCGRDGLPLSVDHVDLWEQGGATVPSNLLTACKKCNKDRGNTPYEDWIISDQYKKRSANLPLETRQANEAITATLPELRKLRVKHIRNR